MITIKQDTSEILLSEINLIVPKSVILSENISKDSIVKIFAKDNKIILRIYTAIKMQNNFFSFPSGFRNFDALCLNVLSFGNV